MAFTFGDNVDPFHPNGSFINLAAGASPVSIQITNTTYAYSSMLNGDSFAKKFGRGGLFSLLTITGYDSPGGGGKSVGEVDFYLANFLGNNAYIVNTWQTVDLSSLVGAQSLVFGLESTDNNALFGMNTPAYFAVDNFTAAAVPEPSTALLCVIGIGLARTFRRRAGDPSQRIFS